MTWGQRIHVASSSDSYCTVSQDQYESIPGCDICWETNGLSRFFYHQTESKKSFYFHMSHFSVTVNGVCSSQTSEKCDEKQDTRKIELSLSKEKKGSGRITQKLIYDDLWRSEANNMWVSCHKCSDKNIQADGMRAFGTWNMHEIMIRFHSMKSNPGKKNWFIWISFEYSLTY